MVSIIRIFRTADLSIDGIVLIRFLHFIKIVIFDIGDIVRRFVRQFCQADIVEINTDIFFCFQRNLIADFSFPKIERDELPSVFHAAVKTMLNRIVIAPAHLDRYFRIGGT